MSGPVLGARDGGARASWERESLLVLASIAVFAVAWLGVLDYTSLAPPVDNIEQLVWVRSLAWGYYKHPPLPTWLIWLPAHLFGVRAWTSYATGAAVTLAAVGLLYRLLAELRGRRHAGVAILAVLCITYYNDRLYYYNHNVALMVCISAAALLCWKACESGRMRDWAALGIAMGLGSLAKYQFAVAVCCVVASWLAAQGWRSSAMRRGLLVALLLNLVLLVPHVLWLRDHDFGPIFYALDSSLDAHLEGVERWSGAANWVLDQVFNRALPAWLLLGLALLIGRRTGAPGAASVDGAQRPGRARAFLLIWGMLPLAFIPLIGIVGGSKLQLQWGTPFLLFVVPAGMELVSRRVAWNRIDLRAVLIAFALLQVLLLAVNYATSPRGLKKLRDDHWRTFDGHALAMQLGPPARKALAGRPLCIVSGPLGPAGALALNLPEQPLVLIDGRPDESPWISPQMLHSCGVLELFEKQPERGQPVGERFPILTWSVRQPS